MPEQLANWDYQWSQVVGQAWADDAFKHRLFANPTATLEEFGMNLPTGLQVKVWDDTAAVPQDGDNVVHLVLPARPSGEELLEEELVGGVGTAVAYCHHCGCGGCYRCYRCGCGGCARTNTRPEGAR